MIAFQKLVGKVIVLQRCPAAVDCCRLGKCPRNMSATNGKPTAAVIVIGDEIIKGQIHDTNTRFLCQRLHRLGVHVERISVIRDQVDTIAQEVAKFSKSYDYVLTSGGIGPTHDDLTFEGVAKAFDDHVEQNPTLTELVKKYFVNVGENSPALRLAQIPSKAHLNFVVNKAKGTSNPYPLVSMQNVYLFPGVPHLLERIFDHVGEEIFGSTSHRPFWKEIFLSQPEMAITPVLDEAVTQFKDKVIFGSYPEMEHSYYKVRLSMESQKEEQVLAAEQFLRDKLKGSVIDFDKDSLGKAAALVYGMGDSDNKMASRLKDSLAALELCLKQHRLEEICISFNGGKDCTALLHVLFAVLQRQHPEWSGTLKTLYIRDEYPFPQLEKFVQECAVRYNLNLITLNGPIRKALEELKSINPEINVAVMGTRKTDPYCDECQIFQPTDPDWTPMMRVSPLLHWSYTDVWHFIRTLHLPYCLLYDRGYTSIGNMHNTLPNPRLQYVDHRGTIQYYPAYNLAQEDEERKGRK